MAPAVQILPHYYYDDWIRWEGQWSRDIAVSAGRLLQFVASADIASYQLVDHVEAAFPDLVVALV